MKKNLLIFVTLFALSIFGITAYSQAPQSFSFQAVARNSAGDLIGNTSVNIRLALIAGSDQAVVWQETHTLTTSDLGLFYVIVGDGTRVGGTVAQFSSINWASDTYSLKVELDAGSGYEDMGSSDLLSVPYALNAASISGLKSLEVNESVDNPVETALFEVKNKDGNTVFAVYNEGVQVFVDDNQGKTKGSKGGFSIGGFDALKGETFEFFRVTPDSVRIYVDEGATKGRKGGFSIGGFDRTKGLTADFMHLSEDNYFIGYESGANVTTGLYNSFFGYRAGVKNSTGSSNVFIGNETGYGNIDGDWNIFLGNSVGYSNTFGSGNIILGDYAGFSNIGGSWNVFLGDLAGYSNTSGGSNVYIGSDAGQSSTIANYNVFLGSTAGYSNTEGNSNVFLGESSGYSNITGNSNVFIGTESGLFNETGNYNVFIGEVSGSLNTIGEDNVFVGASAGELNTAGSYNVFLGTSTGYSNTLGIGNVFLGQETGYYNTEGSLNVAIGPLAGYSNVTGISNVFIGSEAGYFETESNRLYIDNEDDAAYDAFIYGRFDEDYLSFNATVEIWEDLYVNMNIYEFNNPKSGTKGSIELTGMLNKVKSLMPVEFEIQQGKDEDMPVDGEPQIGLYPEEIETLFPYLVKENIKGDKGINYSKLSVILIQAIKEQQDIIDQQQERLNILESKVEQLISQSGN